MHRTRHVTIALGIALVAGFLGNRAVAEPGGKHAAQVKEAMKEMIAEAGKMGAPKLEGSALLFGGTKINGNYALVDTLKEKHKCTATFFAKKADGFVRVATNVIKDDGSRAVGTVLDPKGPAIAAINKGEAYYGVADILGKKYETGYEPIKNAAGEIIGVYYIGYLME
jgi:hypothetical protein